MRLAIGSLSIILVALTCRPGSENNLQSGDLSEISAQPVTTKDSLDALIDFKTHIEPILKAHCTPCHFPGGTMYSKMPFDSARTLLNHQEGILRRIKDPDENKKIREFIERSEKQ